MPLHSCLKFQVKLLAGSGRASPFIRGPFSQSLTKHSPEAASAWTLVTFADRAPCAGRAAAASGREH